MAKKEYQTQPRSYTLVLAPAKGGENREDLWNRLFLTHRAVCEGARVFGELFLNLRGGLSPNLAQDADPELRRGKRRILALGWLSVEDDRGAANHSNRIAPESGDGSLSKDQARKLLEGVLRSKGIHDGRVIADWWTDCEGALTARVRDDSVWISRADTFAAMRPQPSPEDARKILFGLCGKNFCTLRLPEQTATEEADERDFEETVTSKSNEKPEGTEELPDPSKKSRGIYGDLFGGDEGEKVEREDRKRELAEKLKAFLGSNPDKANLRSSIHLWREQQGWAELDISDPTKYPAEVTFPHAPTKVSKRYRKLLVHVGLWPASAEEDGSIPKNIQEPGKTDTRALCEYLVEACEEEVEGEDQTESALRVFKPPWGPSILRKVEETTGLALNNRTATEFRRLMFALAARRLSQTHSWMKRNELKRHESSLKELHANAKLGELDPSGNARRWLAAYEKRRSEATGAQDDYRIAPRAISAFPEIVEKWKALAAENRSTAVDEVQTSAEKFGDSDLFHALAMDALDDVGPEKVWHDAEGHATAEILIQWARLRKAQHDQKRLKVPRFCHPDPFHHPTFCEYGGSSKPKVQYALRDSKPPRKAEPGGAEDGARCVWLLLPNFRNGDVRPCPIRWQSKRLWNDLGGETRNLAHIPRNDRLGRAALASSPADGALSRPRHPFARDAKGWNARLQADRRALEELSRLWDEDKKIWRDGGKGLLRLEWFATFSPDLEVVKKKPLVADRKENGRRGSMAKIGLCREHSLRVLSVDLGHRHAATCAVWEVLPLPTFKKEIARLDVVGGGSSEEDLYLHVRKSENGGKQQTVIYRRIGPDNLDGRNHPAPWARLDREFPIKLQGEDEGARRASNEEIWSAHRLETELGRAVPLIDRLIRAGWGKTDKQKEILEALRRLGSVVPQLSEP